MNEFKPTIKDMIADAIDCLGMLHYKNGKYNYALEQFLMGLKTREQLEAESKNQELKIVLTLFNCGINSNLMNKNNESLQYFHRALDKLQPILDKNHVKLAMIYEKLGEVNYQLNQKKTKYLSEAVKIWKNLYKEDRPYIYSYLNEALKQQKKIEK